MNYSKIYESLIARGRSRIILGYTEIHHIIPRCMGGSNDHNNLVALTPEEHFVAHQLLVKIHPDVGALAFAVHIMAHRHPKTNKYYGWCRREFIDAISKCHPTRGKTIKDQEFEDKIAELERLRGKGYDITRFLNDDNTPTLGGIVNRYGTPDRFSGMSTEEIVRSFEPIRKPRNDNVWSSKVKQAVIRF